MNNSDSIRKPYKAKPPITTINNVRKILEDCSIFTIEKHFGMNNDLDVFSCRVFIANDNLQTLDIGMNGKGVTPAYSLASGYAEFMERLQIGSLFPSFLYYFDKKRKDSNSIEEIIPETEEFEFCYAPDEKTIPFNKLSDNCPEEILNMLKTLSRKDKLSLWEILTKKKPSFISVPFFNINRKKVVNLPIDIVRVITGSNGTCAGNTPNEALLHGLCEIFERFALKKIFFDKIIPPDIPLDFFKNTRSAKIIEKIKDFGNYDIRIKDCSLDMNLPVIGILLIDSSQHKYMFRLGSDPIPEIALERCLTEAYQGLDTIKTELQSIEEASSFSGSYTTHETKFRENYIKFMTNGKGHIPNTVFSTSSSYSFKGFDKKYGKSDSADLQLMMNKIISLGYSIFVRDHSFLGFPAYHILIPGMRRYVWELHLSAA